MAGTVSSTSQIRSEQASARVYCSRAIATIITENRTWKIYWRMAWRLPMSSPPTRTCWPPLYSTSTVAREMPIIIMGCIMTMRSTACRPAEVKSSLAVLNLARSKSSRTKDLTTRMATRFSWTFSLSRSIFSCMISNSGWHLTIRVTTHTARMGRMMTMIVAREGLM